MPFAGLFPDGVPAPRPGTCVCCGNDRRPLASTGREIPGYGTVLVCVGTTSKPGCILQLLSTLGCLAPGKATQIQSENERLQKQNEMLAQLVQRQAIDPVIEVVPVQDVVDMIADRLGVPAK